jgi:hypothetical protein
MCKPDQIFATVLTDVIFSGLAACLLTLLGVFTCRVIVRTRRSVRR